MKVELAFSLQIIRFCQNLTASKSLTITKKPTFFQLLTLILERKIKVHLQIFNMLF